MKRYYIMRELSFCIFISCCITNVLMSGFFPFNYGKVHKEIKPGACKPADLVPFLGSGFKPRDMTDFVCFPSGAAFFHLTNGESHIGCGFEIKCPDGNFISENGTCSMKVNDCYHEPIGCHYPKHIDLPSGNCIESIWKDNEPESCSINTWREGCSDIAHVVRTPYVIIKGGVKKYLKSLNIQSSQEGSITDSYISDPYIKKTVGVTGTKTYCDLHQKSDTSCHKITSDGISEYRAQLPARTRQYITLEGCLEPVYCFGFEDLTIYGNKNNKAEVGCNGCSVVCSNDKIHLTSGVIKNGIAELCSRSHCEILSLHDSITEVHRSFSSKIYDESVKITVYDSDKGKRWEKSVSCPQLSVCNALDCYICRARWLNVNCYTSIDYIILLIVFYLGVCLLGSFLSGIRPIIVGVYRLIKMIVKILLKITKLVSGRAKRTGIDIMEYANDEEMVLMSATPDTSPTKSKNPRKMRPLIPLRNSLLVLYIFMIFPLIVLAKGPCSTVVSSSMDSQECLESGGTLTCRSSKTTIVPIISYDQISCLTVVDPSNKVMAQLQITPLSVEYKCNQETWYHTRNFEITVDHVMRCPGAAYCSDDWCNKVDHNTNIPDLSTPQGPYHRFCKLGSACAGRGCFYCTNSCHSIQYYGKPRSGLIYRVFSCPVWKPSGVFHVLWESDSGTMETTLSLVHGETSNLNKDISLTLDITVQEKMPVLSREFITDGTNFAITKASFKGQPTVGQVGQIQCQSESVAMKMESCIMAPQICICRPEGSNSGCDCSQTDLDRLFDPQQKLPLMIDNNYLSFNDRGEIMLKTAAYGTGKIIVRSNLKLIGTSSKPETCIIDITKVSGCYSCLTGVKLKYQCTSQKPTTTLLHCDKEGIVISIECTKEGNNPEARFQAGSPILDLSCTTPCFKGPIHIKGVLEHVGLVPISNTSHISLAPSSSLKSPLGWLSEFWFSLGWMSTFIVIGALLVLLCSGCMVYKFFHISKIVKTNKIS